MYCITIRMKYHSGDILERFGEALCQPLYRIGSIHHGGNALGDLEGATQSRKALGLVRPSIR